VLMPEESDKPPLPLPEPWRYDPEPAFPDPYDEDPYFPDPYAKF